MSVITVVKKQFKIKIKSLDFIVSCVKYWEMVIFWVGSGVKDFQHTSITPHYFSGDKPHAYRVICSNCNPPRVSPLLSEALHLVQGSKSTITQERMQKKITFILCCLAILTIHLISVNRGMCWIYLCSCQCAFSVIYVV